MTRSRVRSNINSIETRRAPLCCALALGLVAAPAAAEPDMRMAYSNGVTLWSDPGQVEGAVRAVLSSIAIREKLSYTFTSSSEAKLRGQLASRTINMAWLSAVEYVRLNEQVKLAPVARAQVNDSPAYRLLLLTRRRAQVPNLAALRGKRLSYYRVSTTRPYLEVLLANQTPREPERFFGRVVERTKPQSPILDLLLGEAEVCLALDWTLSTMAELNPQLTRELVPLQTSEPLVLFTIATPSGDKRSFDRMRRLTTTIHQAKEGRELLLIFRIQRLLPARDSDFDSVRRLLAAQRKLQKGGSP